MPPVIGIAVVIHGDRYAHLQAALLCEPCEHLRTVLFNLVVGEQAIGQPLGKRAFEGTMPEQCVTVGLRDLRPAHKSRNWPPPLMKREEILHGHSERRTESNRRSGHRRPPVRELEPPKISRTLSLES